MIFFFVSTLSPSTSHYAHFISHSLLIAFNFSSGTEAGIRGVKACLKEKKAYDKCLDEYIKKNPIKLIRVQEEYRVRPGS